MIAHTDQLTARDWGKPSERRCLQLLRLLLLIECLRGMRFPAAVTDLHPVLCERMGDDWHPRTTRRDLAILELAGIADSERENGVTRWRVVSIGPAQSGALGWLKAASARMAEGIA